MIRPLARGLSKLKHYLKEETDLEKFRDDDIRVYRDTQIICSVASVSKGLIMEVQLDINQPLVRSIMKRQRQLLQCGTLICMSNDFFKGHIAFGTVVESDKEDDLTRNGIVSVEFPNSFFVNVRNPGELLTLIESKSSSLSHQSALVAVRIELDENEPLPFEKQIVYHQQDIDPPTYLTRQLVDEKGISFDCLIRISDPGDENNDMIDPKKDRQVVEDILEQTTSGVSANISGVGILSTETWPSPRDLDMDISQYRAFSDSLIHGISLIQGPPGTGKTVIALKILEMFLNNEHIWSKENIGPIILLSYTNHALDQFLKGVLDMEIMCKASETDVVRVGSQSKTKSLDKYNLSHRRKETQGTLNLAKSAVFGAEKKYKKISDAERTYLTSLIHECFLKEASAIPERLFVSLRCPSLPSLPADKTYLCRWLGIFQDDFVPKHGEEKNTYKCSLNFGTDCEDSDRVSADTEDVDLVKSPICIVTEDKQEDRRNGIKYWSIIEPTHKQAVLQEVKRRIMRTTPMSEKDESSISDVWGLSVDDRWRLYKRWIEKILKILRKDKVAVQTRFKNAFNRLKECRHSEDIRILKNARIIAMTTTRAAADNDILRRINPKIMVIEEAAEVPDHHLLAGLVPSLQHLVMIGDHQQLRPAYNDYKTAMRYDLNVSIFERLVTAGLPFQQLQFQHRMRPEIADLLTPTIYRELQNHSSVMEIEDIKGMEHNVYFLNHNEKEHADSNQDVKSHKNQHEVDFIAQLYRYLRLQGYGSEDITVLTTYKEQERLLKTAILEIEKAEKFVSDKNERKCDTNKGGDSNNCKDVKCTLNNEDFEKARVTTVDNFQGEENTIILLSLVRSNSKQTIGFLKESNRICVALSRAKAGLYVIGDCSLLRTKNNLWRQILEKAESNGFIGTSLTLRCRNHPQNKTNVSRASDFQKVPSGGCSLKCSAKLICGHECPLMCHADDPDHDRRPCTAICDKPCSLGHKCQSRCSHCRGNCSPCDFKVSKILPKCGHTVNVPCHKKPDGFQCTRRCENKLECGHRCQKQCGLACNTIEDCKELVKIPADCGHVIQTACHTKHNPVCNVNCSAKLQCGHLCKGTCHSCFAGHFHQKCKETIEITQHCGHTTTISCIQEYWNQKYGGNLLKCREPCEWRCEHDACGMRCGEPCDRTPCNVRCSVKLKCRHLCDLLLCGHNGDHWCRKCSSGSVSGRLKGKWTVGLNPRHIRLRRCGCIFETKVLDDYLLHHCSRSSERPRCPNCRCEIYDNRYFSLLRNAQREESVYTRSHWSRLTEARYHNHSNTILTKAQSLLNEVSEQVHTWRCIELQTEFIECVCFIYKAAKYHITDESVPWRCAYIYGRLCERLRREHDIFSVQEIRELTYLVPKLIISLKSCILKNTFKRKSAKMCSLLHGCENIYDKKSTFYMEKVQKLDPMLFDTIELCRF
ncbi:NFX1-type zinc finger-containing protein 1-like [Pecten maximus]|uniref:NFX1-type zinc finger-containing protein 1-like n=1 Tax=Pecten maximus TaxID=6579 RepID=UPI001458A7F8|nr:NFX1-type zinc finger-containing protein 1-like [Pecten maximus]